MNCCFILMILLILVTHLGGNMKILILTLATAFSLCEIALAATPPTSTRMDSTSGKAPLEDTAVDQYHKDIKSTKTDHLKGTKRTSRMYDTEKPAATGNTKDEHGSGPHADY